MNKFLFLLLLFPIIAIGQIQEVNSEELLGKLIGQLKNGYGDPEVSLRNKTIAMFLHIETVASII